MAVVSLPEIRHRLEVDYSGGLVGVLALPQETVLALVAAVEAAGAALDYMERFGGPLPGAVDEFHNVRSRLLAALAPFTKEV